MSIFQVELPVYGAITISKAIKFTAEKELDFGNIFRSDIEIKRHISGLTIISTVSTVDEDRAHKVALLFIGKMLDILSIKTGKSLNVSLNEYKLLSDKKTVKRVVVKDDFLNCFHLSRDLNLHEPKLLRALNWYRKGLYTDDPFDKFLAFWNSISVIGSEFHTADNRTRNGIINQIWNCFITLWGADCNNWPIINGDDRWINDNNQIRNEIAHGLITVEVNHIENVLNRLESVQKIAYNFITQWAEQQLHYSLI